MTLAVPFIDAILEKDFKAPFNQRHTAHQIWGRVRIEMPACDIGESTVRAYVRIRKAQLDVTEKQTSSQAAAAWMMEVLHSDAARRLETASSRPARIPVILRRNDDDLWLDPASLGLDRASAVLGGPHRTSALEYNVLSALTSTDPDPSVPGIL